MKKIWFLVLSMFFAPLVYAVDFEYTGLYSKGTLGGWIQTGNQAPMGDISNDKTFVAEQFRINSETLISSIEINAHILASNSTTTVNYQLVTATTTSNRNPSVFLPDFNTVVLKSDPIIFNATSVPQDLQTSIPFNYDLQPGTYWLAQEGTGTASVALSQTYTDPPIGTPPPGPTDIFIASSDHVAGIAAPEPSTWALFAFGGFMLWRRRFAQS